MSDGKEMTYAEVAEHTGKKDLFVVIHDEVFDTSSFVDEHPYVSPVSMAYSGCVDGNLVEEEYVG